MCALQGKGIWTLYEDIDLAVAKAPEVGARYILCKVSQHGAYSPANAQVALAKVRVNPDLLPVAWSFSYLEDIDAEVECARAALQDGFDAFILDAEAEINNLFTKAEQFSRKVAKAGLDTSRIYLCSDPRLDAKIDEIPCISLAKACRGGFMPMIYGEIMPNSRQVAAEKVMKASYDQYERHKLSMSYTNPLMPAIASCWDNQGKVRMSYAEFKQWCDQAQARYPTFVSLYRAGVTSPEAWQAFKELQISGTSVADEHVFVQPSGAGYIETFYPPNLPGGWKEFIDASGHLTRYRSTTSDQTMYANYTPALLEPGRYAVETFIPSTHATTQSASYFIISHPNGQQTETRVILDQLKRSDEWATLGNYDLDPAQPESGRVNLVDVTGDTKKKEIAFTVIRWRKVVQSAVGFDAPIGTEAERADVRVWPGHWVDANPYLHKYNLGYHTGADLNLNFPYFDADKGQPIYACADGEVTYAQMVPSSTWGGLVVIKHAPLSDGRPVYTRYAHVENIQVQPGQFVRRGDHICQVGPFGTGSARNYHLHFDISTTELLANNPRHWPGFNLKEVQKHYVDPRKFIEDHRP